MTDRNALNLDRSAPKTVRVDGYYDDYAPQVQLRCPMVLTGVVTDPTRRLGYWLAATEGLPFVDIDRRVEHAAGCSVWKLVFEQGEGTYRQLEEQALDAALRALPLGIIVGGDGLALAQSNRERLSLASHWIGLTASAQTVAAEALRAASAPTGFWHPTRPEVLMDVAQVEAHRQVRIDALSSAAVVLDLDKNDARAMRSQVRAELPVAMD